MDNTLQVKHRTVKKISWFRLLIAVTFCLGVGYGTVQAFVRSDASTTSGHYTPWFAAYVDVTSKPTYAFESKVPAAGSKGAVLAFIVADTAKTCMPSWGTHYTLDAAAEGLDLDRRIARFQQQGGKIAISFGGALNSELALACDDHDKLFDAYRSVIDRYNVSTIDLDLEGDSLRNGDAAVRRAQAVARLQKFYSEKGKNLVVWLTLPVSPQGLTQEGTDAVAHMLAEGVDLAGVNVMTMDYGGSRDSKISMYEASRSALHETHRQLGILYQNAGVSLESASLWAKIGATPMIGQNDVANEVFTMGDAALLNAYAVQQGVGRMSMWSANRDIPCGQNYVDVKVVSDVCSGVTDAALSFTRALSVGLGGDLMQQATMVIVDPTAQTKVVDDPKTAPYPIWYEAGIYLKGDKVVWRGNVYEARWWTKNELPDNPVLQYWETPWQLIGPVLPTDKPMEKLVLPKNLFPAWSGRTVYDAGDRVIFNEVIFRAKWWNQGESPAASAANPESSPWIPLSQEQVRAILKR